MNILSQQHIEGGGEWSLVRVCNFSFYIFINFPADLTQYNNIYMTSKERSLFFVKLSHITPLLLAVKCLSLEIIIRQHFKENVPEMLNEVSRV